MRYIITSKGETIQSKFDLRFGRAAWLCIYDKKTDSADFIENQNKNLNGGAGTKTATMVAEMGVTKIISGDFGPKAKSLLERLDIQMIILDEIDATVKDIINKIKQ